MDIVNSSRRYVPYSFSRPFLTLDYKNEFMLKKSPLCGYTQGCKWAPDGSCFVVASDDKKIRAFNLPTNVAQGEFSDEKWITSGWKEDIKSALTVKESGYIYDYQWYPLMNSTDFSSSCFAVTCRDLPIHLWSAWTGQLICSYIYHDHLDQLTPANSISFSPDGSKLVGGYSKGIQVFDVGRPGKMSSTISSKEQSGIISTLAFHQPLRKIFAAGSYGCSIGLYSLETNRAIAIFNGHSKGVTHVQFTSDGTKLLSGTRKDDDIICWDIRNPGEVLAVYKRKPTTSQKMYFDITPNGEHLISGTTEGNVLVWDMGEKSSSAMSSEDGHALPSKTFMAHQDCVNGISIHPSLPLLVTSSGQRVTPTIEDNGTSDSEEETSSASNFRRETSVKLWWIGELN